MLLTRSRSAPRFEHTTALNRSSIARATCPLGAVHGSTHAVFAPPQFGMPRKSIHRSLACASAIQPLDQPFLHSSIPRATSPLGAVHGLGLCRFRSPRVGYAPGIDPPISCLRLGCPTAGPTILSELYPASYLSPGGGTWARPMPYSLPEGLVRPGNRSTISWLRLGYPTAEPTIPSKVYPQSYLSLEAVHGLGPCCIHSPRH